MLKAVWFVLSSMGVVFATLIALVLVMTALNRWFAPPAPPAAAAGATEKPGAGTARPTHG